MVGRQVLLGHPPAGAALLGVLTCDPLLQRSRACSRAVQRGGIDRAEQQRLGRRQSPTEACPASLPPPRQPAARQRHPSGAGQRWRPAQAAAAAWRPARPRSGGWRQQRPCCGGSSAAAWLWRLLLRQTRRRSHRRPASSPRSPPCLVCPYPTALRGCAAAAAGLGTLLCRAVLLLAVVYEQPYHAAISTGNRTCSCLAPPLCLGRWRNPG